MINLHTLNIELLKDCVYLLNYLEIRLFSSLSLLRWYLF